MIVLLAVSLPACTTKQVYDSALSWQCNQCDRIPDKAESDRCRGKANADYETYKRQTAPEQK